MLLIDKSESTNDNSDYGVIPKNLCIRERETVLIVRVCKCFSLSSMQGGVALYYFI